MNIFEILIRIIGNLKSLEFHVTQTFLAFIVRKNINIYLKNFLDRLIPIKSLNVVEGDGNFDMKNSLSKFPNVVVISNSGFPGENNFYNMHEVMKSANPMLEIYRNNGVLLRMNRADIQLKVQEYLSFVKQAGFQIASKTKLSVK